MDLHFRLADFSSAGGARWNRTMNELEILTKQILSLEMRPASLTLILALGMVQQMSLQVLCTRKAPPAALGLAREPLDAGLSAPIPITQLLSLSSSGQGSGCGRSHVQHWIELSSMRGGGAAH